ncbi:hypothetical protein M404DRAFT_441362 [Pisolithus tinctorius Marx 270]|uniref:Uncharacterized protein n=1 Tax=Pisolithus tinctorius Marx 270 TaxID=870435 RepID=A0A0C3PFW7_PISTI|nr:hypothetical protein M404DRAFT_441362 [Pisolithus tinctorius Marx 270]
MRVVVTQHPQRSDQLIWAYWRVLNSRVKPSRSTGTRTIIIATHPFGNRLAALRVSRDHQSDLQSPPAPFGTQELTSCGICACAMLRMIQKVTLTSPAWLPELRQMRSPNGHVV